MCRDIEVANGQVDYVGKAVQVAIPGSAVFDDLYDAVKTFTNSVGQVSIDKGQDVVKVIAQRGDKLAQRGNAASQCGGYPAFEKLLRRGAVAVAPEVLELVLEHPGAVDTAIGVTQAVEQAGIGLSAIARMHAQQPTQPFDGFASLPVQGPPLILTHLIDSLIEGFDHVEAIDNQFGVGAMVPDGFGVGAAHVATGPLDAPLLPRAQTLAEEPIDRLAALAPADPQHLGTVQVIDQCGEFAALTERDFIHAERVHAPDLMAIADPVDNPVQQIRERRGGHLQDLGSSLLGHYLAQHADAPLQAIGNTRIRRRPGNLLLNAAMGGTVNLLGGVPKQNLHAHQGQILPATQVRRLAHDPAPAPTLRATATVFVGLDCQVQFCVASSELKLGDPHAFQA